MSRLSELIAELCPDGVEYKALGDVGSLQRGKRFVRNDFVEQGTPCIHYGELYTHYGVSACEVISHVRDEIAPKLRYAQPGDVIIVGAGETVEDIGLGVAWLGDAPVAVHDACYTLHQDFLDPVFVSYFLRTDDFHLQIRKYIGSSKVSSVSSKGLAKARIPVPPIEVQREVVRILDEYTAAHDELVSCCVNEKGMLDGQVAALCDELICREGYKREAIGALGTLIRGKRFTAADYVDEGIPSIHYGEVYTEYGVSTSETVSHVREDMRDSLRYAEPGDVIIACTGENKDDICKPVAWLGNEKVAVHDDCHILKHGMDPRYVAYALMTTEFHEQKKQTATESKVVRVSGKRLASMTIPVPTMERQHEIANTLDCVYSLMEQLGEALSEEVELLNAGVQELRNQLLSFPEKVA